MALPMLLSIRPSPGIPWSGSCRGRWASPSD